MRNILIVCAIVAQIGALATMVYGRESVIKDGDRVFLRTAPLDPRDPFRGDYVRLGYTMNNTANLPVQWTPADYEPKRGDKIYAVLSPTAGVVHKADFLTNVKPTSGQFIRGRIDNSFRRFSVVFPNRAGQGRVKFGIEQMFVEQGAGLDIEDKQGVRGGMQVPMEVEIALGDDGTAVLLGYQWSPLGMELNFVTNEASEEAIDNSTGSTAGSTADNTANTAVTALVTNRQARVLSVTVTNVSDDPVVLNNPGNNCGFALIPVSFNIQPYTASTDECAVDAPPEPQILAAGEDYNLIVDLADPRWFVAGNDQAPISLNEAEDNPWFRLVYQSAPNTPIDSDVDYWLGELPSRAFTASGLRD